MKSFLCLLILSPIIVLCQSSSVGSGYFNGEYESYKTSYKDELHSQSNFIEETRFNIAIHIKNSPVSGRVVIQDLRIPDKLLIYKIVQLDTVMSSYNGDLKIYDVLSQHLESNQSEKIIFYNNENKQMNLMVLGENSSQVFYDIKKNVE